MRIVTTSVSRSRSGDLLHRSKHGRSEAQPHATILVANRYGVPPSRVFRAWLDPRIARRWLFATASRPMAHVEIDGRVGGAFRCVDRKADESIEYVGEYIQIVPDRRIVFTLSMEPHPSVVTRVAVAIATRAKGCALQLTHENVPQGRASDIEGRWTGILYGLGVTLDSLSRVRGR